jgi:protein-export membrane protein SecD
MGRGNLWKGILVLVLLVAGAWQLLPTLRLSAMSEAERAALSQEDLNRLHSRALHLGLDLQGGMHLALEVDKSKLSKEEAKDAVDRALEIIRNRVDQFGVSEPLIQKQGQDRIIVELPGVDKERAKALIGKTALLEFRMLADPEVLQEALDKLDKALAGEAPAGTDTAGVSREHLFTAELTPSGGDFGAAEQSRPILEEMLSRPAARAAIPVGYEFLWGKPTEREGVTVRSLYLLKTEPEITGSALVDARLGIGTSDNPNEPRVDFVLSRRAAGRFAALTGANIGKRLAIVLDRQVHSAPVIQTRIPDGRGQIELGGAVVDEAKDLAIILRAGALPAPVKIIEERSVGPSLGQDSISKGVRASLWGAFFVAAFMLVYYSLCGGVADLALVLNLFFLMAVMAGFRFTLTLPGIAGIALTAGMAVDANVLIFERVREELRTGKTVRASIEAGYKRAFTTILDSNVTALMGALALYWFGSGPIRGFAVTLSIGILVSMFTAIVVTRMIFDFITTRFNIQHLRI